MQVSSAVGFRGEPGVSLGTYGAEGVDGAEEVRVVLLEGHGHKLAGLLLAAKVLQQTVERG
jgi:hypothetical protein